MCPQKVGRFHTQESPLTVAFRSIVMTLAIAMFVVSRVEGRRARGQAEPIANLL